MRLSGMSMAGLIALGLAFMAMMGMGATVALVAIGLGGVSVWGSFRKQEHQYLFLGMAAILIALVAIWNYASQVMAAPY